MKKSLLLGCAAMLAAGNAFAYGTDGCTYEAKDGITMTCLWAVGPDLNNAEFTELFGANGMTGAYARNCAVKDGKIYIPVGGTVTEGEGEDAKTNYNWTLKVFDMMNGALLQSTPITLDGGDFNALLGCNNIGFDDYGHCWVGSYWGGDEANLNICTYQLDINTGVLTPLPVIEYPADEIAMAGRLDFYSLTGDITATEADCYMMANASGATFNAYRFVRPQGSDAWEPGMDGYAAWMADDVPAWPAGAPGWGDNPTTVFALGCNDIAYMCGRNTLPTQYSCAGGTPEMLGSFEAAGEGCAPEKPGATGAWEFVLGDKMYLGYGDRQGAEGGRWKISRMGGDAQGGTFEGMELMWNFPSKEEVTYCSVSNGAQGAIHPVLPYAVKDENGKEGVYITTFYGKSELGVYLMAQDGFNAGVAAIEADNANAPKEYYNLQGMKIENPANGLYIVKQGNKSSKQYIK